MRRFVLLSLFLLGALFGSRLLAQQGLGDLLNSADQSRQSTDDVTQTDQRSALPSSAATKQALTEVKDVFREDYALATTPSAKLVFARQLLSQAAKTTNLAEQWALYSESMRLAADAGDMELCFEAIDLASRKFIVDAIELKLDALSKLAVKAPLQAFDGLARAALAVAQNASDSENPQIASKSLSLAAGLARKTKNRTLAAEVTRLQQAIRDREKESRELAGIVAKLAANPSEPDICLEAGKYFCFKAGDWSRGLPLLAKGSDTELSRLAVAEVNVGKTADAVTALGDAWWGWADRERGASKSAGLAHAADLYATVVPKLQGLDRTRLEKRIKQAQSESTGREKRIALADLKEESATGMQYGFAKDGTFQGKPFTCRGQEWPKGLTAMTHEKGTSIVYKLPPGAKRLVGTAGVFGPAGAGANQHPEAPIIFEILLDGQSAWKSPPLPQQNSTADFAIDLFGATTLELQSKSKSGSGAWSAWLNPEIVY